jgi:predicted nucleic acid-binding protein
MPRRIYVDSCVLMAAFRGGEDEIGTLALKELNRSDAIFLYSRISELETIPQPTRNRRAREMEFFRTYFDSAERVECNSRAMKIAMDDACKTGMQAADALHVGCAALGEADELVTSESSTKPLLKATAVKVRSIRAT